MPEPRPLPLTYGSPPTRSESGTYLRSTVILAATPLVTGLSILIGYVTTRAGWLAVAGVIVIVAGLFSFVLGAGTLCSYVSARRRELNGRLDGRSTLVALLVLFLLLSNVPAALFCMAVGGDLVVRDLD